MKTFLSLSAILFLCACSPNWGKYQGKMDWYNAVETCKAIGKRLPTRSELRLAYRLERNKKWDKKQIAWYWTGESKSEKLAYNVHMNVGKVYGYLKTNQHQHVRCIR